jgi:hypothetical protein
MTWYGTDGDEIYVEPEWMRYALNLGYTLAKSHRDKRPTLAVLSTPAESCIAGLIALAAQLALKEEIAEGNYYQFLCGLAGGTVMTTSDYPKMAFTLGRRDESLIAIRRRGPNPLIIPIKQEYCSRWTPVNADLPEQFRRVATPTEATTHFLRDAFPNADAWQNGIARRSTPLVFLGPAQGRVAFDTVYNKRCFLGIDTTDETESLGTMLGLRHGTGSQHRNAWGGAYINPRSPNAAEECKTASSSARFAIFDGPIPFLKHGNRFPKSTRLLVMSRAVPNHTTDRIAEILEAYRSDGGLETYQDGDIGTPPPLLRFYSGRPPERSEDNAPVT